MDSNCTKSKAIKKQSNYLSLIVISIFHLISLKARVAQYEQMVAETQKMKNVSPGTIVIPPGPRLGLFYHLLVLDGKQNCNATT